MNKIQLFRLAAIMVLGFPLPWALAGTGHVLTGKVTLDAGNGHKSEDGSGSVVFIVDASAKAQPPRDHLAMASRDKAFVPEVLPVLVGTTVDFPNDDLIMHNVFSLSKAKPFDLGLYKRGRIKSVTFDQPGLVKIYCNIHAQMAAYILVLNNPYYAIADVDGNFAIPNIPDGTYTVSAWHRTSAIESKVVTIRHENSTVDFRLNGINGSQKHMNKFGKDYPDAY